MQQTTLSDFYKKVNETNKNWRYGQVLFNCLVEIRPDLSEQIRGTDKDPFYENAFNSEKIQNFFAFIEANW